MPSNKGGANGDFTYTINDERERRRRLQRLWQHLQFANPGASLASDVFSPYNSSTTWIGDGFVRANVTTGILTNHLTVFANSTDLRQSATTEQCYDINFNAFNCTLDYRGTRFGAEYLGQLAFGPYGTLIFGARNMTESMGTRGIAQSGDGSFTPVNAQQTTNSAYGEYRLPLFSRLDLTFGGRVDSIQDGQTFVTGRATVAYHIDETGTKLRAAFGDGAKAPTLFQRFSLYGDASLLPEKNVGGEIGIDQSCSTAG